MPAWEYRALDAKGNKNKGVIESDSARQVRQQLRDQGLFPVNVAQIGKQQTSRARSGSGIRIPLREQALFTRQLSTLVESGLPLEEVLFAIARQTNHKGLHKVVLAVRSLILEGYGLAEALAEFPRTFDALYRAMVDAGERSGSLGPVLSRLADHNERQYQLRGKIKLALLYPTALTLVAISVIILLMTYVVPKVVAQFDHVGQTLPWLTRWLINVSDFLVAFGPHLLAILLLMLLAGRWYLSVPKHRYGWHRLQLQLPLTADFVRCQQALQFARTLGILVGSGLDLLQSLKIAAAPVTNLYLRRLVEEASDRVREGASLAKSLEHPNGFPSMLVYMIASGELSGELEPMLLRAAENQETEFESRLAWLIGLFEPILILVMGVVVLAIVLAILLPILQLNNLTGF